MLVDNLRGKTGDGTGFVASVGSLCFENQSDRPIALRSCYTKSVRSWRWVPGRDGRARLRTLITLVSTPVAFTSGPCGLACGVFSGYVRSSVVEVRIPCIWSPFRCSRYLWCWVTSAIVTRIQKTNLTLLLTKCDFLRNCSTMSLVVCSTVHRTLLPKFSISRLTLWRNKSIHYIMRISLPSRLHPRLL